MNYKYLVITLLAGVAIFHIGAVVVIGDQNYQLTSKDYYGQEVAFDDLQKQLAAGRAFVWQDRTSRSQVEILVHDVNGQALDLQQVKVQLYKPNDASQDLVVTLEKHGEGIYSAPAAALSKGPWKLTLHADHQGTPVAWQTRIAL